MVATLNATVHGSTQREQLIAHWDLVDGKLICHWNVVKPTAEPITDRDSKPMSDNLIHFPASHHAA
jgi:hypothetical protein